ncbi:MAG: tetratricopeptide repeat protein [Blastocatellia bacterium]
MSFNKAKALKSASKYIQQGRLQGAIEEYQKITQADPADITTLNTLGDLYVRVGDTNEALRTFLRIAEHYRAGGFNLKAIAMLKKVTKLDPNNVDVLLKLAGLYAQQKLIVDARQQYLAVAEHFLRLGQQKQALDIYQQVANLDPENTAIQLKLADAYIRENQPDRAYEALMCAGAELQRQGNTQEALNIFLKAIALSAAAPSALHSAINLYIQRGDTQNAVGLISQLLRKTPDNADLLNLLGRIHQSAGNLDEAEDAFSRAFRTASSCYPYILDFCAISLRYNDPDRLVRLIDLILETLFNRREEDKAIALLQEVLAKDPSHLKTLNRLATIFTRLREDHNLIEALNNLADAAIRKGEDNLAIDALVQLSQLEPEETKHERRLRSLGLSDAEIQRLASQVARPSAPAAAQVNPLAATPGPAFDSTFSPLPGQAQHAGAVWGEIELSSTSAATPGADLAVTVSQPGSPFVSFSDNEMVEGHTAPPPNEQPEPEPLPATGAETFNFGEIDLSEDFGQGFLTPEPKPHKDVFQSEDVAGESANVFGFSAAPPMDARLREELESVDFYLSQGMAEVAAHTLESLSQQYPGNKDIAARQAKIRQSQPVETPAPDAGAANPFAIPAATPLPQNATRSDPGEISFAFSGGVDLQAGSPFDSLLDDLSSIPFDQAPGLPAETKTAPPPVRETPAPRPPASSLNELSDLFDDFQGGAAEALPDEGDFETHYNLGLAYKDMEMFDEAVEEFQQAYKIISKNKVADAERLNQLNCCNMLGFCFSRKNLPRLAVLWFKKGIEVPGRLENEYQALRYDLAASYEAIGEFQNAHDTLSEIYAIDVNYRNISARLSEVQARLGS